MSDKNFSGSIEVIFGPMFSGKSTELLRRVKRNTIAQKKCLLISYAKDNRYSSENVVSTHDKQMMKALKCMTIEEALPHYKDYDVIAIDEGQFFVDVRLLNMCIPSKSLGCSIFRIFCQQGQDCHYRSP